MHRIDPRDFGLILLRQDHMADAASLHCPNCGAITSTDAQRCPYCSARLATISCPSCFALMFDSAAYCERCGVRRERVAEEGGGAPCPGCGTALDRVAIGSTELFECAECDGVWVAADVFERICSDRESQAAVLHRGTRAQQPVGSGPVRYRRCLACGTMMNRVNFGKVSGTIVDVCRGHGTFLDRGELQQIVRFIHGGGLEQARERQIQELREQERRLRELELKAARDRSKTDPHTTIHVSGESPGQAIVDLLKMLKG
jgi:Zn-finger nucleic acid-binding protein